MSNTKRISLPYLVQRGNILNCTQDQKRLGDHVEWDYMGSAEFEFGALPKSMRRAQKVDPAQWNYFSRTMDVQSGDILSSTVESKELYFYSPHTQESMQGWLERIEKCFKGRHLMKESLYPTEADLWWDIENEVFFSTNKVFIKRLPDYLQSSWEYMDKQAENK